MNDGGIRVGLRGRPAPLRRARTEARRPLRGTNAGCTDSASSCAACRPTTTTRARCVSNPVSPYPGFPGLDRRSGPGARTVGRPRGRLRHQSRPGHRPAGRRDRPALGRTDLRGRRPRPVEPATQPGLRSGRRDSRARELGTLPPVPGHQRAAGGGRHRRVPAGTEVGPRDRRRRAGPAGRLVVARRGLPQGLPRPAPALREPLRPAVAGAGTALGPGAHRPGLEPRRGRRVAAHAPQRRPVERLVQLHVVTGARRGGRRRRAAQLGPDALGRWRRHVVGRRLAGDAGGQLSHRLAHDAGARGRTSRRRRRSSSARAIPRASRTTPPWTCG